MVNQYENLGGEWNDEKYRELGQIVHRCAEAMRQPISELKRCETFLIQLSRIIAEYEQIHLGNGTGAVVSSSDGSTEISNSVANDQNISSLAEDIVLYFRNSSDSEVREWRRRLNSISERVATYNRENFSNYIPSSRLNRPLSATVRYETRESFNSRGESSDVLGYNDGVRSRVVVGTGHELQTTVHENLHQLSNNGRTSGIITRDSQNNECNRQVNEAITELYTQRTLGDDYGSDYSAYSSNRDAMAELESAMGRDLVARAYFQNQPELLQQEVDSVLGYGHWDAISFAFERCVSGSQYEIEAGCRERDRLIAMYVTAVNNRNGGTVSWRSMLFS